jgi:methionyl-tRNA formyltransferase
VNGAGSCRIVFVGVVEEGRRCLEALLASGERFAGFVTLKDEPAARTSGAVPFDDLAERHGVPLLKVRDLNHPANVERMRALAPDLILVIGWTRLVGREILAIPRLGCVGFHASLLPRYRGRAPVNWAIINGESETGNTMFFLDDGVDTGDVIAQRRIPIDEEDTCATLYAKVAASAVEMLRENLPLLKAGRAPRVPQDPARATVMPARRPEDGIVDWSRSARDLHNWVRALTHPYPGAFTGAPGRRIFIWKASVASPGIAGPVGVILRAGPGPAVVGAGAGALVLEKAQAEGFPEEDGGAALARLGLGEGSRIDAVPAPAEGRP